MLPCHADSEHPPVTHRGYGLSVRCTARTPSRTQSPSMHKAGGGVVQVGGGLGVEIQGPGHVTAPGMEGPSPRLLHTQPSGRSSGTEI